MLHVMYIIYYICLYIVSNLNKAQEYVFNGLINFNIKYICKIILFSILTIR